MTTQRQKYIDSNFAAAREAGCDTVQLKYDGWWSKHVYSEDHKTELFTRTGRLLDFSYKTPNTFEGTIVGELMYGTNWSQQPQLVGKVFAFDCTEADGVELYDAPYRDRYGVMRAVLKLLPAAFIPVQNFPIHAFETVWQRFVVDGDFEGVVFRNSHAKYAAPVYRQKNVVVSVYQCVGFEEGQGKFVGTLGALKCRSPEGAECAVGGGFDNSERDAIWTKQADYIGRFLEVEGRKRFVDTGLLRHPNFVSWKD